MLSAVLVLSILALSLLIAQFLKLQWVGRRFPPGPTPLPFLGNLWTLNFRIDRDNFIELAKTYGNIYTVWLGQTPIVVINGYEAVRNSLISYADVFAQRPMSPFFIKVFGDNGIVFSNGHTWKQQRRFSLMTLRNLGLGKRSLEMRILEEAQHLVKCFAVQEGKPIDPYMSVVNSVSNVICAVVFGHRFSMDDKLFLRLINVMSMMINFRGTAWGRIYDVFSPLMPLLPGPHKKVFGCWEEVHSFVREEIKVHRERRVAGDPPEDLIDYYQDEIAKTKDDATSVFNENNLRTVVLEFFLASIETTSTSLLWGLLYMVEYPDVQEKVQKELDAVLEPSEIICYEDRKRLPYTNAVIHEVQRYASIVPGGVGRQSLKDTSFQGFFIPKGAIIFGNLTSALYDPEHWETPRQFNPSHFLDEEGKFVNKEAFMPFSAGHRVCLGEQLARTELFIFITSLLRAFTFHLPRNEEKKISSDYVLGTTVHPLPYQICAVPRWTSEHHGKGC